MNMVQSTETQESLIFAKQRKVVIITGVKDGYGTGCGYSLQYTIHTTLSARGETVATPRPQAQDWLDQAHAR